MEHCGVVNIILYSRNNVMQFESFGVDSDPSDHVQVADP